MPVVTTVLGHPRSGHERELEGALARYGRDPSRSRELVDTARTLRQRHWTAMKRAGIEHIPCNDFSLHDHVLDIAVMLDLVPRRFQAIADPLTRYFALARGTKVGGVALAPLSQAPWFDTAYRYTVPELRPGMLARLDSRRVLGEVEEARALGLEPRPVLLGPVSFLMLSRLDPGCEHEQGTLALLDTVLDAYAGLLMLLHQEHVDLVQLDEPCLVGPLTDLQRAAFRDSFARLSRLTSGPELVLTTYFGALAENLPLAVASGFGALHIDLVRAPEQLDPVLTALPASMRLSVGVIDGSAAQRTDLAQAHALVRRATERLGTERVWVAPSCSLLHAPSAQATPKLAELRSLADVANRSRSS